MFKFGSKGTVLLLSFLKLKEAGCRMENDFVTYDFVTYILSHILERKGWCYWGNAQQSFDKPEALPYTFSCYQWS